MEDQKLKLKLRIPNKKDEERVFLDQPQVQPATNNTAIKEDELEEGEIREDDPEEVPINNGKGVTATASSNKRVCPHCGREFDGGKALGGHLRVHAEPKSRPDPGPSNPSPGPNPDRTNGLYPCTLCPKKFPSEKALFGHMRSHPERQYRGMQDPGSGSGSGPGPGQGKPFGIGWNVKGYRGLKRCSAKAKAEASSSSSFNKDEREVAEVLCHFADYAGKKRKSAEDQHYSPLDYSEPPLLHQNSVIRRKGLFLGGTNHQIKRKIIYDNDEHEVEEEVEKKWECLICNKTFPSHQALGGHVSSHNKLKPVFEIGSTSNQNNGEPSSSSSQYKCKICNQSFSSGQALGGHQRCHYVPSSSESSPEQISSHTGRSDFYPFEFDLNAMAIDDEDDGNGDVHVNGDL